VNCELQPTCDMCAVRSQTYGCVDTYLFSLDGHQFFCKCCWLCLLELYCELWKAKYMIRQMLLASLKIMSYVHPVLCVSFDLWQENFLFMRNISKRLVLHALWLITWWYRLIWIHSIGLLVGKDIWLVYMCLSAYHNNVFNDRWSVKGCPSV
jgi:hypothetical protein